MPGTEPTRIAIFGGSFSPVHKGHIAVANGILAKGLAEEVWMMPCRRNPLKESGPQLDEEKRLSLLKAAARYANERNRKESIRVDTTELTMPSPSYTIDTLRKLQSEHPSLEFRLAVGADSYLDFHKWKEWEELEKAYSPIVYPRPGYAISETRQGWTLLEGMEENDISSTQLREMLEKGEDIEAYMPWLQRP